ncbi:MAG: hypothetical protein ACRD2W_09900 [Acidimicrobiales bacterium]
MLRCAASRRAARSALVSTPRRRVDAIVAAEADGRANTDEVRIITSDTADLEFLASLGTNPARLSILPA